jgi:hypothetical protein
MQDNVRNVRECQVYNMTGTHEVPVDGGDDRERQRWPENYTANAQEWPEIRRWLETLEDTRIVWRR